MKRIWIDFPRPVDQSEGEVIARALTNMFSRLQPKGEDNIVVKWDNQKGFYVYEYTDALTGTCRAQLCNGNGYWYTLIGINEDLVHL